MIPSKTKVALALAAVALGTAGPAPAASSDEDFASALGAIHQEFRLSTQEAWPLDPLLLSQAPLINLVKTVRPSVVMLRIDRPGVHAPRTELCSGFFADASQSMGRAGVIVTAAHCVQNLDIGAEVSVGLYAGDDNRLAMAGGRLLACGDYASGKDIAFVELNDARLNRPPLPLWWKLDVGERVVAIGNPLGLSWSVSQGVISALGRERTGSPFPFDMNQSDAAINNGSSGGPLFNLWGSVVGINLGLVTQSGGFEGIGLSVPANYIAEAMKQYRRTGNLKSGGLSVSLDPDEARPVEIGSVLPGGPGDGARLKAKDRIVRFDGIDLDALAPAEARKTFLTHLKYMSPGEKTSIVVRRDGRELAVEATLGDAPAPAASAEGAI